MNNKNKNTNKGFSAGIAVMVLFFIISASAELGEGFIVALIALAVAAAAFWVAVKKAKETHKKEQTLEEKPRAPRKTVDTHCEYDELNCDFSHDYEKRIGQLNSFLKNGIIDRAEYNVLRERYTKNYEEHKS